MVDFMKAISLADAKAKLSQVVTDAEYKKERTVISKHNKPAAVIIGYEEYRKLETLEDMYESRLLEESLKKGKFVSYEDVAKRLNIEL
jgi:prevent-host-death family protein